MPGQTFAWFFFLTSWKKGKEFVGSAFFLRASRKHIETWGLVTDYGTLSRELWINLYRGVQYRMENSLLRLF